MTWSECKKSPLLANQKKPFANDLWFRCKSCEKIQEIKIFQKVQNVCLGCGRHYFIKAKDRISFLLDKGSFSEYDSDLQSSDPLDFFDSKSYSQRIKDSQKKSGNKDAVLTGSGMIGSLPVEIAVFDFSFMGGSMGEVVGEKITRTLERALEKKHAAIIVSSSGGARMQEGILSLMQMAKICATLSQLKRSGVPFLSVLTHPTTGGVAASYALLGDVNIAEPEALIGFAGPRVIEQTISATLPEGFQTSEYLLEKGAIDFICERQKMRETLIRVLRILKPCSPRS
jgi:acetyl-CoA carboxylase carboxyl transferase subunit beta